MIPKVIHACWFGGPLTPLAERCLASWRRFAPDWEVRVHGLGDFPAMPPFAAEAVRRRRWAMASDWARMKVLRDAGGAYFDLDVELVAPLDRVPAGEWIAGERLPSGVVWRNPGSGLALERDSAVARHMLAAYEKLAFDPKREMMDWINRELAACAADVPTLPPEVFSPLDANGVCRRTEATVGIHRYAMSGSSLPRRIVRWLRWHRLGFVADLAPIGTNAPAAVV